jgi:NTE family protein
LPVMRNGQALVDGGVINNVPADVLVAKGCNFVIAVNVSAKMKLEFSGNRADTQSHKTKPPSTLQTLVRTYVVQSATASSAGAESADVVIEPDLTSYKLTDFVRTAELAKVGEETTRDAIPKIKELLAKLDGRLFANQSV